MFVSLFNLYLNCYHWNNRSDNRAIMYEIGKILSGAFKSVFKDTTDVWIHWKKLNDDR